MDILRFITAGSVDDGKSTLIGRLLYDSKSIFIDQLEAITSSNGSNGNGNGTIDLSLLTDGLRAEREQGITIDVAYKYFSTPKRKFIIADTPGHFQYTRNMVTGASNSALAVILVDARNGVTEQTKRHSIIASLLGISHLVICINKMDLVAYSEETYKSIIAEYEAFVAKLDVKNYYFIPISALTGDNVVVKSLLTPWFSGKTLLSYLEEVPVDSDINLDYARFPVQYVIRPRNDDLHDYRGYAGKITSGIFRKGDRISVFPSGFSSEIKAIEIAGNEVEEASAPLSAVLHLHDDIDISRGDLIAKVDKPPVISNEFEGLLCWMDTKPLSAGHKYLLQHNGKIVKCAIREVIYEIDINTYDQMPNAEAISLNDICRVRIKTATPLSYDPYNMNKANGSFILIDENTNVTSGAGMLC